MLSKDDINALEPLPTERIALSENTLFIYNFYPSKQNPNTWADCLD